MKNETISFVVDKLLPPKYRAVFYSVALTGLIVLWAVGKITAGELGVWLENIAVLLGATSTTLAVVNRPRELIEEEVK